MSELNERLVAQLYESQAHEVRAWRKLEAAREELAALRDRVAELEAEAARLREMEENHHKSV